MMSVKTTSLLSQIAREKKGPILHHSGNRISSPTFPTIFPMFSPTCSIDFPYPVQHMAPGKDLFHQRQLVHHGGSPHQAVVAHGKDQHESRPWKKSLEMGGILWELSGNMEIPWWEFSMGKSGNCMEMMGLLLDYMNDALGATPMW